MDNEKIINNRSMFLDIYKFIFEITHFTVGFTWNTLETLIDRIIAIFQVAVENNIQIGIDPLLNPVIEEISTMLPKGNLSSAQWKQKRIVNKYQKLCEIYSKIKIAEAKEKPIKINNIDDYFKVKKFIQISTIGKYLCYKPLDFKYYETFNDFLNDIKKIISNKNNPNYKICHFYVICKEIINDVPNLLLDDEVDDTNFNYLLTICKLFSTGIENQNHLAINTEGLKKLEYQKTRIIKLNLINKYSDKPYTCR